jgi:5-(carboxyamino)imidazole ribonucleotide synthase
MNLLSPLSELTASKAPISPLLPNAILGVLGGGQLGKMFCAAAQRMGYRVWVLDPDPHCPTAVIADHHLIAPFDDIEALTQLRLNCEGITTEFENVPATTLAFLAETRPVSPSAQAVSIVQHRKKEKMFLRDHGFPTAPFCAIESEADIEAVPETLFPALLKTAQLGYDGKGQCAVMHREELLNSWKALGCPPCILEKRLHLELEVSVMVARTWNQQTCVWPAAENIHQQGILDVSIIPARLAPSLTQQAQELAIRIATTLDYTGILGVEYFVVNDTLYINELAPRPHNSGHYTLEASVTSQFEQQVRVLCGLPLGATTLLSPVAMMNVLGDAWIPTPPNWPLILAEPGIKLHLYGKSRPLAKRKMGHLTCLATSIEKALEQLAPMRKHLGMPPLKP